MFARLPAPALPGLLLLGLLLLGACGLPPNTAVGDWSRTASIGTDRPSLAAPPREGPIRAMQQALGAYFSAIAVLWDNAELRFQAAEFAPFAQRAAAFDPAAGEAIQSLAVHLHAASVDRPLQSLPRDNSGPRPLPEDWRLVHLIGASDGAVQLLLAALARAVQAEAPVAIPALGPPAGAMATDPVLRELQQEAQEAQEAARAARLAAAQEYGRMLTEIGAAHAVLKAQGRHVTQREVERRIFLADDRLRRAIATLPREAPRAPPAAVPSR